MAASIDHIIDHLLAMGAEMEDVVARLTALKQDVLTAEQERDGDEEAAPKDRARRRIPKTFLAQFPATQGSSSPDVLLDTEGCPVLDNLEDFRLSSSLAQCMGPLGDNIIRSRARVARFDGDEECSCAGLAFSLSLPPRSHGIVEALKFRLEEQATCAVYTKVGGYEESLSKSEDWSEAWTGELPVGQHILPLSLLLSSGKVYSIYLCCPAGCFSCSARAPALEEGEPLILTPGRAVERPFCWPQEGDAEFLNTLDVYFAGSVTYIHCIEANGV